jgi:hypothetical protein
MTTIEMALWRQTEERPLATGQRMHAKRAGHLFPRISPVLIRIAIRVTPTQAPVVEVTEDVARVAIIALVPDMGVLAH